MTSVSPFRPAECSCIIAEGGVILMNVIYGTGLSLTHDLKVDLGNPIRTTLIKQLSIFVFSKNNHIYL